VVDFEFKKREGAAIRSPVRIEMWDNNLRGTLSHGAARAFLAAAIEFSGPRFPRFDLRCDRPA